LFRATGIDLDDCLSLVKSKRKEIDLKLLKERFHATASYDISEDKVNNNLEHFFGILRKNGIKQ
jgi:hypothetical protein